MRLNEIGYDPVDDDSDTGYRRPPHDAAAVCDYFHELAGVEDDGKFAVAEMDEMLNNPLKFFGG